MPRERSSTTPAPKVLAGALEKLEGATTQPTAEKAAVEPTPVEAASATADEPGPARRSATLLVGGVLSWLSPKAMMRSARQHPWMSVAMVLSMAIPMFVAWFPTGSGSDDGEASLDKLPMPGKVQFHDGEPAPIIITPRTASRPPQQQFEPGWDMPESNSGAASRFANYRDDVDATLDVNTVGAEQPAPSHPRGAWLTGVIEEFPQQPKPGAVYRGSRRY